MSAPLRIQQSTVNISVRPQKQIRVVTSLGGGGRDSTKVSKTGDTMTGNLTVPEINFTSAVISSGQKIASNTDQIIIDTFDSSIFRGSKYILQASCNTNFSITELLVLHDNINIYLDEYGQIGSNTALISYTATVESGNVKLLGTPENNNTTINFIRYSTKV